MRNVQTRAARAAGDNLPGRLLSDAEFQRRMEVFLAGPAASGYAVRLSVLATQGGTLLATYSAGTGADAAPSQMKTLLEDEARAVTCRCELWRTSGPASQRSDADEMIEKIGAMIDGHWGDRDPATMLPNLKTSTGPARFAASAREMAMSGRAMAVLHTDLDHFKKVNTEFGEVAGDGALREFASRLRDAFRTLGVVVRTGGEEFSALLDCEDVGTVLRAADDFRRRMQDEPLQAIGRANTCSVGLCLYPDGGRFATADHQDPILFDARDAERRAKDDGRNRIALVGPAPDKLAAQAIGPADLRETALAACRQAEVTSGMDAAFRSAIRTRLADAFSGTEDIEGAANQVRGEFGLLVGNFAPVTDRPPQLLGILTSTEWAGIVASSLLAATWANGHPLAPADRLALVADGRGSLALDISGKRVPLGCEIQVDAPLRAGIGAPRYQAGREPPAGIGRLPMPEAPPGYDPLSPVLLLPIGDQAKAAADKVRYLVAGVVDVDDRPTRGGGLPDFWQSNLSRVIRACLANPNVTLVMAVGDVANARLTMQRLQASSAGRDLNELQRRLSMKADDLTAFAGRSLAVWSVAAEHEAVLAAVERAVEAMIPADFPSRPVINQGSSTRRRLAMGASDETHRLATTDGLRTRTLADAYPEAVQLVRSAPTDLDQTEPQRGAFREMTGFKVVLTEPLADRVPDYWQEDVNLLDAYYQDSFGRPDSLFGSRLHNKFGKDEHSMVEFAVGQATEATIRRMPTRRINLPIMPDSLGNPLGLSSLQVMPRDRNGTFVLDTICVWRSVDALVGFPFSAYGSIRWAAEFLDKVNLKLSGRDGSEDLRMGTLTYIAVSFHMYLHDGDVEIARTIVQDASL